MKKHVKMVIGAALILVCIIATLVFLFKPVAVATETVKYGELTQQFVEQGSLDSRDVYTVGAKSEGYISEINVPAGRRVSAGDVLVTVDDLDYQNTLSQRLDILLLQKKELELDYDARFGSNGRAKESLEKARSLYNLALSNYEAGISLFEAEGISKQELMELDAEYRTAESEYYSALNDASEGNKSYSKEQISSLRSQIDTLRNSLKDSAVTTPFEGIVGKILVEPGQYVMEHQQVVVIYSDKSLYIKAFVLDEDAYTVKTGTEVTCSLPNGTSFAALVTFVSPLAEERLSTIGLPEQRRLIELTPQTLPKDTAMGSKTEVTFDSVLAKKTLSVPSGAVVPFEKGYGVYVAEKKKLRLCPVELGLRASGRIQIVQGLEEGDEVLLDPYADGVKEGARVKYT